MKRKMISAVLAAVMTVGMITGCGSSQATTENKADKADKLESQTDLSSTDYDFEKEFQNILKNNTYNLLKRI